MYKRIFLVILFWVGASSLGSAYCGELVPLYPKSINNLSQFDKQDPGTSWPLDPLYELTHVIDDPDYYLSSGVEDDTFFVVFHPPAACSVCYAEIMWLDSGSVDIFCAFYSDEAEQLYPEGLAPNWGASPVSPLGGYIVHPIACSFSGSQTWEMIDLGEGFIVGNPVTLESDMFGVGYIKNVSVPHPLADNVRDHGIYDTHTWFGGPWNSGYPYPWGGYTVLMGEEEIELMIRVWVSYPFGMGSMIITIQNVTELSDTYNTAGPFTVNCSLWDENGIGPDDITELHYTINEGDTITTPLEEITPGSDYYSAEITGPFSVGDEIEYWIHTVKDNGYENNSFSHNFTVIYPENPEAGLLLVNEGYDENRELGYSLILDDLGIEYEYWNLYDNNGIDESVVYWGWDNIIVTGWGIDVLGPEDENDLFNDFLDDGGNLCLIDQDWFYANGYPAEGTLEPGDFGYDYFGIESYYNDTGDPEAVYNGVSGDPITGGFFDNPYETWWDGGIHLEPESFWADYIIPGNGEGIFFGVVDNDCYGVRNTIGDAKTVYLSFMAEASCEFYEDSVVVSDNFRTLITNICEWFEIPVVSAENPAIANPLQFELYPNHPNPFNAETTISFYLPRSAEVNLSIYNTTGQLIETLISDFSQSGNHRTTWRAERYSSGIYFCRLKTGDFESSQKLLLLK